MAQSPGTRQGRERAAELAARALRLFGRVEPAEIGTVALLALDVFVLLTAYYMLKVIREPLILLGGGAEVKSYAAVGQVVLLVGVVRLYGRLCDRFDAQRLIRTVTLFFVAHLLVFYGLGVARVPLGVPFFLWVGIFSVTLIAQFWSFANDIYTREQGERLFPIVGIGSSLGAVFGAQLARLLLGVIGIHGMLLLAAATLVLYLGISEMIHRHQRRAGAARAAVTDATAAAAAESGSESDSAATSGEPSAGGCEAIGGKGTLRMFLESHYLLLLAALTMLLNWVNTLGEYVLDRTLLSAAHAAVAADSTLTLTAYIGAFRANFFGWVNVIGLLLQMFVVSRAIKHFGVRASLFVLPLVSLGGYALMALVPLMAVIAVAKVAENSLDYSLEKTAREALFLVLPRDEKYKAKNATDTVCWRAGDVLAAGVVYAGNALALSTRGFVMVNVGMVMVWLAIMVGIAVLHRRMTEGDSAPPSPGTAGSAAHAH